MFDTLRTLISGVNARANEHVRDTYSVELIEQKIREATTGLKAAKVSLAGLIQRKRAEERQAATGSDAGGTHLGLVRTHQGGGRCRGRGSGARGC